MRVISSFIAAAFVALSVPAAAAPPPSVPPDASMMALCRLWNAVRFVSPDVVDETDARWDAALITALQTLDRDPASLRTTAAAMLQTLGDPMTEIDTPGRRGVTGAPSVDEAAGVRVIRIGGYPGSDTVNFDRALASALTPSATTRAVVIDVRSGALASDEEILALDAAWTRAAPAARFIDRPLGVTGVTRRTALGFPSELASEAHNGGYAASRIVDGADLQTITPVSGPRAMPLAIVSDAHAYLPPQLAALVIDRRAALFSEDGSGGLVYGDAVDFAAGAGLDVSLRTGGPEHPLPVLPGGIAAARAWLTTAASTSPSPVASASVESIEKRYSDTAFPDSAHRELAAFRIWGAIEYASPYRALMHDDWDGAFVQAVRETRAATTSFDYETALLRFYAHLHDSHVFVQAPAMQTAYRAVPAFVVQQIEGRATIVRADPGAARRDGFAVGDVIDAVDGESVGARLARLASLRSASTPQSLVDQLENGVGEPAVFAGPVNSFALLRLHGRDGRERTVRTARGAYAFLQLQRTRPTVDVLAGNVGYMDLDRLQPADVEAAIQRLRPTRAIIMDMRGYPHGTAGTIAAHITPRSVAVTHFRTPVVRYPIGDPTRDMDGSRFLPETRDFDQIIDPVLPRLAQPIVVLINERAISQAEHTGMFLRAAGGARFVGEPTSGADGDVTAMVVPGGITLHFSGQSVAHADGAQLQRIGLIPDVRAAQTLADVRAGVDDQMLAGLKEALREAHAGAASTAALAAERRSEVADALEQREVPKVEVAPLTAARVDAATFSAHGMGYSGGIDPTVENDGGPTLVLRAGSTHAEFGSLSTALDVTAFAGKRVRVSGYLRSQDAGTAAFWLRIDGADGKTLAFDNMPTRSLVGTRDWTPFAIVLDVPEMAKGIAGGLLLAGGGTVWASDVRVDAVKNTVNPTAPTMR